MFAPVYLDWNATSPLADEVREAMLPWLGTRFGNASSRHEYGRQARAAIDEARARVAASVGAHQTEVVFVSGGSEANNLFMKGAAAFMKPGLLAISAIEHPCVREPAKQLARNGWELVEIGVDTQGRIDETAWQEVLARRPALISTMLANNETGVIQPIQRMSAEARAAGAWMHTDAVQALGKIPTDFRALGVHALSLSSHKIGGPIGSGALIVDKRLELAPLIAGGGQERGLRSGTENVAAIVGFGVACELAAAQAEVAQQHFADMRDSLEEQLAAMNVQIFGREAERLPNTSFFAVEGIDGETLVGKLDRAGFACASGSACSSAQPEPSHTLTAMAVEERFARNAVRVSLGPTTTRENVENFARTFAQQVKELRKLAAIAA